MILPINRLFTFLIFTVSTLTALCQSTPQLTQQVKFETGLDEVLASKRQNAFLVISADNYTLVDQSSKLQLGTLVFDAGGWAAQGVGKTTFLGDSNILISTARVLMLADPITGKLDTFFSHNQFPEYIEGFIPWPGDEDKILIHTKTYILDKDSNTTCFEEKDGLSQYLGANNNKLYLYDAVERKIISQAATPHLFTYFSTQDYKGNILAGTLEGDIVQVDTLLQQQTLFHALDTTIHSVFPCGEYIAVIPSSGHRYVSNKPYYGEGAVYFFKDGKRKKIIAFEEQQPADNNGFSMLSPSNTIFRAFYTPANNSVLVNYGFSRLASISLKDFSVQPFDISYNMAKFYCLGTDHKRLLAAMDEKQTVFASARMQGLFDVESKKFLPAFKQYDEKTKYTNFYKTKDNAGNYHIIAYKSDYSRDSLIIYSSNKTQPTRIGCNYCHISIDIENHLIGISKYRRGEIAHLKLDKLAKDDYEIEPDEASEILETVFTTENIDREKLPPSVNEIYKINSDYYLIQGVKYKKDKTYNEVLIADTAGNLFLEKRDLEALSSKRFAVSPSKKFVAIAFGGDKPALEVWDLQSKKMVFKQSYKKMFYLRDYTFDKTKDVLWFTTHIYNKKRQMNENKMYSLDLSQPNPKEKFEFADERFFSYQTDMANDRIAFEAYAEIYVARLSTLQVLWHKTPYENYIDVGHTPNGFCFSSPKEFHVIENDTNYLYFTTFGQDKPVEVANEYLYKGSKQAINNLAFVYNRNAYLPADYDLYFNRPDKILTLSGSTNDAYNTLISEAYAKRNRKTGAVSLDALLTQSPQLEVTNKNSLPYAVKTNSISLDIEANSPHNNISRLHIVANGVPIYGENGLPLTPKKTTNLNQKVELQTGNNTLQVYVEDEKGIISSTQTVNIVADYEYKPKTYFIGIGIDKFIDSSYNLSYSAKDVYDLKDALQDKLGKQLESYVFINEDVKMANITHLNSILDKTNVNDKVVISYSGHGVLDKNLDYYLSTYAIDFKRPAKQGLPYKELEKLLDSIPARQKLLLIDACHSGEVDKEAKENMSVILGDSTNHLTEGSKSGIQLLVDEPTVGLKNSFELMQELFVDVGKGTGTNIISAAAGTQVAYEKGNLKNGVFTYCILQMLKEQNECSVQQLKSHVSSEVQRLTNGLQKPTSRSETVGFDWKVW